MLETFTSTPPEGEVLIALKGEDRGQVEIRDGVAYLWRYKSTDQVFCQASEITRWRGCNGFDF